MQVKSINGWRWVPLFSLALVALPWLPIVRGGFVWDDVLDFIDHDWLTGADWTHYLFRDFNWWNNYFRPLGLFFWAVQLRLFGKMPGPMHGVSLVLHLLNVWLVGRLAARVCAATGREGRSRQAWVSAVMLLYGMHPALIESVGWIGCQFDLMLTLFVLLGLWANSTIASVAWRALAAAGCFFLAACTKEAAVVFPLLLVLWDWLLQSRCERARPDLMLFLRRNAPVYAAVFMAGLAYIVFRRWGLDGAVLPPHMIGISWVARVQTSCSAYMHYWRMLFVPTSGMAPLHLFDYATMAKVTPTSLMIDVVAIALVAASLWFAWRHASALACIVLAFSIALLPVLRVLTSYFDDSLYHERYITCGLAMICALLPALEWKMPVALQGRARSLRLAGIVLGLGWLASAVLAIGTIAPLWGNSEKLWKWELTSDPNSDYAKDWLLGTWLREKRFARALPLMDRMLDGHTQCASCALRIAGLALSMNDVPRAEAALELARTSPKLANDPELIGLYYYLTGRMLMAKGQYKEAEAVLGAAVKVEPAVVSYREWHDRAIAAAGEASQ